MLQVQYSHNSLCKRMTSAYVIDTVLRYVTSHNKAPTDTCSSSVGGNANNFKLWFK